MLGAVGLMGRGRRRLLRFQLRQGLIDFLKFVLDLSQVLATSFVTAIEQRPLPLK